MDYRILGPVEVWEDGRPVPLGGGKQRAVLALLLLNANRVVSSDRLIDQLWDGQPPATAATALHGHVSGLRKALGPGVIATRRPGYVLEIEPEQIDLRRFERLRDEARSTLERGDPSASAETLREALEHCRGEALADIGFEPSIQAEAARLEDLRLAALEDRIDADLAVGRSAELVDELQRLVATHPLRERLWGQLMLSLYRSGRQAEALDAYRRARLALVSELGLEPGPGLRDRPQGQTARPHLWDRRDARQRGRRGRSLGCGPLVDRRRPREPPSRLHQSRGRHRARRGNPTRARLQPRGAATGPGAGRHALRPRRRPAVRLGRDQRSPRARPDRLRPGLGAVAHRAIDLAPTRTGRHRRGGPDPSGRRTTDRTSSGESIRTPAGSLARSARGTTRSPSPP